jgi:hypothetical protein
MIRYPEPVYKGCLRIIKFGLSRNEKKAILKKIEKIGFEIVKEQNSEDIHTINRRICVQEYIDGKQNMKLHDWSEMLAMGIHVEYAGRI